MARAYAELFTPSAFDLTTFPNDEGYDELVLARAIPLRSVCEHHLLPFIGVAHVGYLPGERILGLSKLARVVEHFARAPAGAGAADQAGRRLARRAPAPAGRRRGHRGRAHLHDPARRPGRRLDHRDLDAARGGCATTRDRARSSSPSPAIAADNRPNGGSHDSSQPQSVVIVGGGLAGAKAAEALREQGYAAVTPLGDEADAALRAAAAVEGLPGRQGRVRGRARAPGGVVRRARRRPAPVDDVRRHSTATAHTVTLADGRRCPTTRCSSRPAPSRAR